MSAPAALRFVSAVEFEEAMLGDGRVACRGVTDAGGLVASQTRLSLVSCNHEGGCDGEVWAVRCVRRESASDGVA